jgi:hypothetical protein
LGATLVALGVGAAAWAVASSGTPIHAPRASATRGHVPGFVAHCLAEPDAKRGACFAGAGRGHVPGFVAHCLAKPDAKRGACFAGARP